ncbi:hypothetical protein M5C97_18580 [Acidovorax sp. NCPPB 3859]|nr:MULTISPECIES: hypothetical protein [unclassified Acidovorax]MDA8450384.1 hypothetical protein [Acidovorax sp. GBBC 3297]MDA8459942.1 hypothetical protein [Acidovorax sp. GBBC 3333]MDA8464978.1 hypothetical protein [Acidovorax sp. GBBC 3332]MDA8469899.1 hypothetical protein [Acidovorax sp. GBBC 3299]WCM77504.1 hypothetical protein M5C94_18530 [Acidovorax sp. GBBC 712]
MALTSLIQVLKVNDKRSGSKDGRAWEMQDAECVLLNDDGEMEQVGVLQLPKALMGEAAPVPGIYMGAFALQAGMRDRRINAILTALTPYTRGKAAPAAGASAPAAPKV